MNLSDEEIKLIEMLESEKNINWLGLIISVIAIGMSVWMYNIMMYHELSDGTRVLTMDSIAVIAVFLMGSWGIRESIKSPQDKLLTALAKRIMEIQEKETSQQEDG